MNNVTELKQYVVVHARGQNIPGYREVLDRIQTDEGDGPGSWVGEWCRAGERQEAAGSLLEAGRNYALARFPYVDGPARQQALERCVSTFDRWRMSRGTADIERLDVDVDGSKVGCWATGLSTSEPQPLLLVLGGIVTVKEQWAPLLASAGRLGLAAIVTELPGAGENPLRYGPDSWTMLSALLDAVADRADVQRSYAMALSFSGHLALRCALADPRLRGVITVGAPVADFFTDVAWQRGLPRITVDTLAQLTGTPAADLPGSLSDWALTNGQLASLRIPVSYTASRRDEIIPAADVQRLRRQVPRLRLVENDDEHGSPRHTAETQLWCIAELLRMRGGQLAQRGVLRSLYRLRRATTHLSS
ncbi:MAG TPA: alpha/beta hydrolase [Mycobacteriales bacterium]|nr:alpha/beta hydrolase [Mycobacteriales bacterium]